MRGCICVSVCGYMCRNVTTGGWNQESCCCSASRCYGCPLGGALRSLLLICDVSFCIVCRNHVGGRALSLWWRRCACASALGLSRSGSCASGLAGSGDIDHVRVIQPVAGPGSPMRPAVSNPRPMVFVGTHFPSCYKCSWKIGPDNWIQLSGPIFQLHL
jgi:hypothetical protein